MIVAHVLLFVHWPALDTVKLVLEIILSAGAVIALLGNIFTRVVVAFFRHKQRQGEAKHGPLVHWQGGLWKVIFPFAWSRFERERSAKVQEPSRWK
jgi:hypothetical protein